jgi:NAD(P)-dependent dehydrogenase (short-subunit alcohol dehydrogenase family)
VGGVDALTRAAAVEVAKDGISVNALAFMAVDVEDGMFQRFFETANIPLDQIMAALPAGRLCRADELCAAVRFLCSTDAGFMTGHDPPARRRVHGHVASSRSGPQLRPISRVMP